MTVVKRGDRVSLDKVRRLYFFQEGEGGISLAEGEQEMTLIPDNATDLHLEQINRAIRNGHLKAGWPDVQAEEVKDDDSELKDIVVLGRKAVNEFVNKVMSDKTIKHSDKVRKLEKLLKMESETTNRSSVTAWIERGLKAIGGVSSVEDSEQKKVEIKLTSGEEEPEKEG